MAKLDEVKEILTSLRIGLSIVVGLLVVIVGSTIKLERSNEIDIYFYIGLIVSIVLVVIFLQLIQYIKKFTKEIKDL
jgi:hypothetical protein